MMALEMAMNSVSFRVSLNPVFLTSKRGMKSKDKIPSLATINPGAEMNGVNILAEVQLAPQKNIAEMRMSVFFIGVI